MPRVALCQRDGPAGEELYTNGKNRRRDEHEKAEASGAHFFFSSTAGQGSRYTTMTVTLSMVWSSSASLTSVSAAQSGERWL